MAVRVPGVKARAGGRGVNLDELRKALEEHARRLREVKDRVKPRPGELAGVHLEEEFDD